MSCAPLVKNSRRDFAAWRGGRQGSRRSGPACGAGVGTRLVSSRIRMPAQDFACRANPAGRLMTGDTDDCIRSMRKACSRRVAVGGVGSRRKVGGELSFRSVCRISHFKRSAVTRTSGRGLGEVSWRDSLEFGASLVRAMRRLLRRTVVPSFPRGLKRQEIPLQARGRCAARRRT